jgi:hypothetical protein
MRHSGKTFIALPDWRLFLESGRFVTAGGAPFGPDSGIYPGEGDIAAVSSTLPIIVRNLNFFAPATTNNGRIRGLA